ncbi:carbohydrate ABC transporter substrate-binding protein [Phaeobacter inhibens]|uniref:ABC transporter substrate-binding protein n=1 Tax=Phaeobacter inhibens TaxID=221822 RepID=UPI000163286D|nr:ABC transporter substrate-binding protein [Phaeobacter inhibens]AFO91641.1 putative sugar-binding periplasmic protein [Phaeobacter inhibens DSM 17395]AUQ46309.1 putative sugar-binding periplasmic protein [Phaeobacter inhibens]AXT23029.1 carbohydrate ABC transporter substrate-binding protein [Phaeobacter inhibens]
MNFKSNLLAGVATLAMTSAATADGIRAEVIHWWVSAGEAAAIKVFADAYTANGGEWIDNGIGGGGAKTTFVNRLMGGDAPQVGQFNTSREFEEIVDAGLLHSLDAEAEAGNWSALFPGIIDNVVKRDGSYYAVPVNIHGSNWLWHNNQVMADAGLDVPTDWDSFFEAAETLKEAGIIPLAVGGEAWQERLTFNSVLLSVGGQDLYLRLFEEKDTTALTSDEMKEVFDVYSRLRTLVRETDPGSPGRSWNDATNMVITGQAAMQIMGDWAKGEFLSAGMTPGVEYGCTPAVIAGSPYMISGDVFVFPKTGNEEDREAQSLMATTMLDAEVQVAFNNIKGSIPVRPDVDTSQLDVCGQQAIALTSNPDTHVGVTQMYISSDLAGALQDVYTQFWNSETMTTEEAITLLSQAYEIAG